MRTLCIASCSLALLVTGCEDTAGGDAGPPDAGPSYRAECENINLAHCLTPWPSSRYLAEDPSTTTGLRVSLPLEAMPVNSRREPVDPTQFERFDGFSPSTTLLTSFPGAVDPETLNGEADIAASLEPGSTTVLWNAVSGERVPHIAELDQWPEAEPGRVALYIRPMVRLQGATRYVVGIRGVRYEDGSAVQPSAYFAALRDGTPLAEAPGLEARRAHFEEVFSALADAGMERSELVEAWDFVTGTDEVIRRDMLAMREDALGVPGEGFGRATERGLGCTVTQLLDADAGDALPEQIWRRISGTVTVPLYLEGTEPDHDSSLIHRGPDGLPAANGTAEVPFMLQIPVSARDSVQAGSGPARLEIYGHGILGDRTEVQYGWHNEHQQRLGVVSFGLDWWGMSETDGARIIRSLQDFSLFRSTPERLHQAMINFLVATRSFRGVCSELPELQVPMPGGGSAPAIDDTSYVYYYGNSQGGTMGVTVSALSTDFEHAIIGVAGMAYPFMIKRSENWETYGSLMSLTYPDALEREVLLVASGPLWELAESAAYASMLQQSPLPGVPVKQVLMHIAIDDRAVPNLASYLLAQEIGIPYLAPSPDEPYGLPPVEGPVDSAAVIYRIPEAPGLEPGVRSPGSDDTAHEGVRRVDAAMEQIDRFARPDGQIVPTCDGACDPD